MGNNKVYIMWTCIPRGEIIGNGEKKGIKKVKLSVCPSFKFPENISEDCKAIYHGIVSDWPEMARKIDQFKITIVDSNDNNIECPIYTKYQPKNLDSDLWKIIFGRFPEVSIKQEEVKEKEPAKEFLKKYFFAVRSFSLTNIGQVCSEYKKTVLEKFLKKENDVSFQRDLSDVQETYLKPLMWEYYEENPAKLCKKTSVDSKGNAIFTSEQFLLKFENTEIFREKMRALRDAMKKLMKIEEEKELTKLFEILKERDRRRLVFGDDSYLINKAYRGIEKLLNECGSIPSINYNAAKVENENNKDKPSPPYDISWLFQIAFQQMAIFFQRVPNLYKHSLDQFKGSNTKKLAEESYTFTERIALLNNHPILFDPLGLKIEICFDIDDKILKKAEMENLCIKVSPEWKQEQGKDCCIGSYSPGTYFDEKFLPKGRSYEKLFGNNGDGRLICKNVVDLQIKNRIKKDRITKKGTESLFELQTDDYVGYGFKMLNQAKNDNLNNSYSKMSCKCLNKNGKIEFIKWSLSKDSIRVFDIPQGIMKDQVIIDQRINEDKNIQYLRDDYEKKRIYNRYFTGTFPYDGNLKGQDYHVKIFNDIRDNKNKSVAGHILITVYSKNPPENNLPPSARTGGISLVKTDRSSDVFDYKLRELEYKLSELKGEKDFNSLKFYADDIRIGDVPELYKENPIQPGTGMWFSLTRREERYEAHGLKPIVEQTDGILRLPILKSTDSTDANAGNTPQDLYVAESLFQWNGESLGLSKDGSFNFSEHDFKSDLEKIKKLCSEINDREYDGIKKINTIEELNEILKVPDFYDRWKKKENNIELPQYVKDLIRRTDTYRSGEYEKLPPEIQYNLNSANDFRYAKIAHH